jgi:hypothetical protein
MREVDAEAPILRGLPEAIEQAVVPKDERHYRTPSISLDRLIFSRPTLQGGGKRLSCTIMGLRRKGKTIAEIRKALEKEGLKVGHTTVRDWLADRPVEGELPPDDRPTPGVVGRPEG